MIKFIDFSDTHLGFRQYKLKEREFDFFDSFNKVIEFAIKNKVDFILHNGDLFNNPNPSIEVLLLLIDSLKKLKEKNIEFLVIPGNHDIIMGNTIINILDKLGLVKNLWNFKKKCGEYYCNFGYQIEEFRIFGIPYTNKNEIKRVKFLLGNGVNILLFHNTLKEINKEGEININHLPKGFNYYFGGHYHIFSIYKNIYYPGSTNFYSINEILEYNKVFDEKYFLFYDGKKLKKEVIKVRPFIVIYSNDEKEIKNLLEKYRNNGIAIIKTNNKEINVKNIEEYGKSLGFLYVRVDLKQTVVEKNVYNYIDINNIENEFLEKLSIDRNELDFYKKLLDLFGKKMSELEKRHIIEKLTRELFKQAQNFR